MMNLSLSGEIVIKDGTFIGKKPMEAEHGWIVNGPSVIPDPEPIPFLEVDKIPEDPNRVPEEVII